MKLYFVTYPATIPLILHATKVAGGQCRVLLSYLYFKDAKKQLLIEPLVKEGRLLWRDENGNIEGASETGLEFLRDSKQEKPRRRRRTKPPRKSC